MMLDWLHRRAVARIREIEADHPADVEKINRATADLNEIRSIRAEADKIRSEVSDERVRNGWADAVRSALGGGK